jgi:hypothetical protein
VANPWASDPPAGLICRKLAFEPTILRKGGFSVTEFASLGVTLAL